MVNQIFVEMLCLSTSMEHGKEQPAFLCLNFFTEMESPKVLCMCFLLLCKGSIVGLSLPLPSPSNSRKSQFPTRCCIFRMVALNMSQGSHFSCVKSSRITIVGVQICLQWKPQPYRPEKNNSYDFLEIPCRSGNILQRVNISTMIFHRCWWQSVEYFQHTLQISITWFLFQTDSSY